MTDCWIDNLIEEQEQEREQEREQELEMLLNWMKHQSKRELADKRALCDERVRYLEDKYENTAWTQVNVTEYIWRDLLHMYKGGKIPSTDGQVISDWDELSLQLDDEDLHDETKLTLFFEFYLKYKKYFQWSVCATTFNIKTFT